MKAVFNENAPRGHYSPGIIHNGTLYISGQTSADPATGLPAPGGFEAEMEKPERMLFSTFCAAKVRMAGRVRRRPAARSRSC